MSSDPAHVDDVTGQTTTGHEWDGIRELNTPLPRWWLTIFYLTIAFSFVYWILYPAWPIPGLGFTRGILGHTNRGQLALDLDAAQAARMQQTAGLRVASFAEIDADPKLLEIALAEGKAAFGDNCAPCHGAGGQGQYGYPDLAAGRWLWGGTLDQIDTTITHGIRADDPDTHTSAMPAFGKDGILKPEQIRQVADYVRTLAGFEPEAGVDVAAGKKLFADNCSACHGDDGKGNIELGAPNLTTKIWLYGVDIKDLVTTIALARNSTMPAWGKRLDPETIKALAIYVHSLGGGT